MLVPIAYPRPTILVVRILKRTWSRKKVIAAASNHGWSTEPSVNAL